MNGGADEIKPSGETAGETTVRERFRLTLAARAKAIKTVRNDVYTTKPWQLALNFVLGASAIALLTVGMIVSGLAATLTAIFGGMFVIAVVVYNFALRKMTPSSFLQYTNTEGGERYTIQLLGKERAAFCDGKTTVVADKFGASITDAKVFEQYRFDFFADMDPDVRIGKTDREIFKGSLEHNGKTLKCEIVFKDGLPFLGKVGGARIKYFDVNDTKQKFVVPAMLKEGVKSVGLTFPKLAGVHVRDGVKDVTKQ